MIPKNRGEVAIGTALKAVGDVNVKAKGPVRSFHKYKLKNGLTVLLKESHKSPVVSVQMWVRTGSADERKGEEGISHFIEHLVFKGSEKFGVGEIAATVEASGGEINAYTSFDQTVFYVTISKEFTNTAMGVISQMMGFPKFDGAEIDNEREVVIEEIKRGNDSLSRQAGQLLFSSMFKKHPYGLPVIGYEKVIRKVSRAKILDYFDSRYNPENMFLVISGNFETPAIKPEIAKYFEPIPKRKLRKVKRAKEPAQKTTAVVIKKSPFKETNFSISWKVPGALHKDIPALDVLALILGQGESSRLFQRLRIQKHLVNSAYATCYTPQDIGLFAVSASINANNLKAVLAEIEDVLIEALTTTVTRQELEKAINNFRGEQFYSMETVDGLARRLGSTFHLAHDVKFLEQYLKHVEKLKPEDLVKAARKYLKPENLTFSMLSDHETKVLAPVVRAWMKGFAKRLKAAKVQVKKEKIVKAAAYTFKHRAGLESRILVEPLPGGGKLILRPSYDTPVVSLRAGFLGGLRTENADKTGVTELLSRTWTSGTSTMSEEQIAEFADRMASSVSAFGGRNTIGLSMETLDANEDQMLKLFEDIWRNPTLPKHAIEREKAHLVEQLKNRKDNPTQIASMLFLRNLFNGHPYALDMSGTEESLPKITQDDLLRMLKTTRVQGNLVVTASGSIDIERVRSTTSGLAASLPAGGKLNQKFAHKAPSEAKFIYEFAEKQQSHIIYGFKGLTFTDNERMALQVMQSVLAGQGGRLFVELRDKASLAYSVAPMRMEGIDTGYVGAYIGCSPEKGAQAISMMEAEFKKLIEKPIHNLELARAQRYLIGRHDIELQRNSAIAGGMLFDELYNVGHTEIFEFADHIRKVKVKDVQNVARALFSTPPVVVAVGPIKPW